MISSLPPYAQSPLAIELLRLIAEERPDYRITRGAWIEGGGVHVYQGKLSGKLRRLHREWEDREIAALDRASDYSRESAAKVYLVEQPNALITRLLAETDNLRSAA